MRERTAPRRIPLALVVLVGLVASACGAPERGAGTEEAAPADAAPFANLGFDDADGADEAAPARWDRHGPTVVRDEEVLRSGQAGLRITQTPEDRTSLVSQCAPPGELAGARVRLAAHLRAAPADGFVGDIQVSSYVSKERDRTRALTRSVTDGAEVSHPERGVTTAEDWTERQVEVEVHPEAIELCISVILRGAGTLWADDLSVEAAGT